MEASSKKAVAPCLHCGAHPGVKARNLCHACYARPAIRFNYSPRKPGTGHTNIPCLECGRVQSRRLCWACEKTPGVREKHRSNHASKFALRGYGLVPPTGFGEPTEIMPGPAKVAILEARAEAGLELWHPCDAVEMIPTTIEDLKDDLLHYHWF